MKVISVFDEDHDYLTTAASMKAAWQYLVRDGWLSFDNVICVNNEFVSVADVFAANGWEQTEENLVNFAMSRNEEEWEYAFTFVKRSLVEEE